jgi:hypothetical protein
MLFETTLSLQTNAAQSVVAALLTIARRRAPRSSPLACGWPQRRLRQRTPWERRNTFRARPQHFVLKEECTLHTSITSLWRLIDLSRSTQSYRQQDRNQSCLLVRLRPFIPGGQIDVIDWKTSERSPYGAIKMRADGQLSRRTKTAAKLICPEVRPSFDPQ